MSMVLLSSILLAAMSIVSYVFSLVPLPFREFRIEYETRANDNNQLEGGSQAYRLPIPLPGPSYPPGQGPLVPNNSPASDAEFEKGGEGVEEDGYKDDVTKEDKMKNLAFVADGKNVLKRMTETTRISSIDNSKGKELLHVLQQNYHQTAGQREPEKLNRKKATEVNWFTTARGKTVKINLPRIQTSEDKGRLKELVQEEKEEENDSTLVNCDEDTDSEGGVTIPVQDQL